MSNKDVKKRFDLGRSQGLNAVIETKFQRTKQVLATALSQAKLHGHQFTDDQLKELRESLREIDEALK